MIPIYCDNGRTHIDYAFRKSSELEKGFHQPLIHTLRLYIMCIKILYVLVNLGTKSGTVRKIHHFQL